MANLEDFRQQLECIYKNERYSARDNGAVVRYALIGKRSRPTDNNWTFGKLNGTSGYLEIASVRIHRIVATAFHGVPPAQEYVVDHIDTNKQNNRPENLRWVTRLENILLNPVTARRIEIVCGSVEAFLAEPSKFRDKFSDPNYGWMCAVSEAEAETSLQRMLSWANSSKSLTGGSLGEWIFDRASVQVPAIERPNYIISKTHNAAQRIIYLNDKPNEYPSTPQELVGDPIEAYRDSLKVGAPFFRNHNGEYIVVKSGLSKDGQTLYALTKSAYVWRESQNGEFIPVPIVELDEKIDDSNLPHSLTAITYEDGLFIHEKMELGFHPVEELESIFTEYTQD